MAKSVTFTIHNGDVVIEASGFKGGACDAATKAFEEVLGGQVTEKKRKTEYHERAAAEFITVGKGSK